MWPSVHCVFDLLYRFVLASSRQAVDDQNESVKAAKKLALLLDIYRFIDYYYIDIFDKHLGEDNEQSEHCDV